MITKQRPQQQVVATAHHDFQKGLNLHAFFRVHEKSLGEDLVQDTFVKTWNYLIKGGKINLMKAFLYHILNNLIVDEYRKHKATSLDVLLEKGFDPSAGDTGRIADILDGKEALLLIHKLPEPYQKVIHMRYAQDLSLEEMSLITGQKKNTIAVQVHRGLEKLKVLYNNAQLTA